MLQRPTVILNMAVTADGKIDSVERGGARISGDADAARVDRLRAAADAVMVGGRTLLAEDPRLTIRDARLIEARRLEDRSPQPAKVAVVSRIDAPGGEHALPVDSRFLHDDGGGVLLWTTTRSRAEAVDWLQSQGSRVTVHDADRVDLPTLMAELATAGVASLLVEGGSTLAAALLDAGLVDELQLAVAPMLLGGDTAPTPVGGRGRSPGEAIDLALLEAASDEDGAVILRYRIQPRVAA